MTNKELLYVEDALGHEQYFTTRCNEIASQLTDTELKDSARRMQEKHQKMFADFYNLLDERR